MSPALQRSGFLTAGPPGESPGQTSEYIKFGKAFYSFGKVSHYFMITSLT